MSDENGIQKSRGRAWLDDRVLRDDRRDRIAAACAGTGVTVERLEAILARAVIDDAKIMECSPESVFSSMIAAAELGLSPSGHHNGAYFARYKNECKLGLGYGAMIELATRDGRIRSFKAEAVWPSDEFTVHAGTDNRIEHAPDYRKRKGEPDLYYAVAFFVAGGCEFEVMTRAEVDKVRQTSRNANGGPWKFSFDEMAKKTVIRRLMKRLPLQPRLAEVVEEADLVDGFEKGGRRVVTNEAAEDLVREVLPGRVEGEPPRDEPTDEDLANQPAFDLDELPLY